MREVNENVSAGADQRATAEAIERGGVGMTVSDLLAKVTGSAASVESSPAAHDADELATAIAAVAGRHVPAGHLAPDADFFDAGGTSVGAVELVSALEEELGVSLDLDEVFADARPIALAKSHMHVRGTATAAPEAAGPEATWPAPPPAVAALPDSAPSAAVPERADPLATRPTPLPAVQARPPHSAASTALSETATPVATRPVPSPAAGRPATGTRRWRWW